MAACESRDPTVPLVVRLAMREFHDEVVIARPRLWPWISGSEDKYSPLGLPPLTGRSDKN
jgi:hypothetical protein